MGRTEEALDCYDKALEIDLRNEAALTAKGSTLYNLGRYEEFLQCLDKALEKNQKYGDAWFCKGNNLDSLGRYDEAICCYDKALELSPNRAEVWYNKGFSSANLGLMEEALRCYDKSLSIEPHNALAWLNKSNILDSLGRREEAILCCNKALETDPNNFVAWNNKGDSLHNLGHHEEAIHCFEKALEINPKYGGALNNKALSLKDLGRYEEAIRCSDQALMINGDLEDLDGMAKDLFNLASVYAAQGELYAALPLAQQSAQLWDQIHYPMKEGAREFVAKIKQSITIYLGDIMKDFQNVNSPTELEHIVKKYPIMLEAKFLEVFAGSIPQEIPPNARPAYKERLEWLVQLANNKAQVAHQVFFYQANSLAKLHIAVRQYPFMIDDRFIEVAEQVINEQIPSQSKSSLNQRLNWLKQIASQRG